MPRHIVCLTFDHDHLSGFIARGLTSPTAISRGEYDMVVIPRLVSLLARYDIKATFFTPGHTIDSSPEAVTPYVEAGHELAHHGWTHRLPVSKRYDSREIVYSISPGGDEPAGKMMHRPAAPCYAKAQTRGQGKIPAPIPAFRVRLLSGRPGGRGVVGIVRCDALKFGAVGVHDEDA
jgi:hypothetical protein